MYVSPRIEATSSEAIEMLAASLPIGEGTVDGGDALVKENDWEIFGSDEGGADAEQNQIRVSRRRGCVLALSRGTYSLLPLH